MAKYYRKHISDDPEDFDWTTLTEEIKGRVAFGGVHIKSASIVWEALLDERVQKL